MPSLNSAANQRMLAPLTDEQMRIMQRTKMPLGLSAPLLAPPEEEKEKVSRADY
jgi:hypothetical protein